MLSVADARNYGMQSECLISDGSLILCRNQEGKQLDVVSSYFGWTAVPDSCRKRKIIKIKRTGNSNLLKKAVACFVNTSKQ